MAGGNPKEAKIIFQIRVRRTVDHGSNPAHYLFLCICELRIAFAFDISEKIK